MLPGRGTAAGGHAGPGATVDVTAARKAGIAAILTSLIGVFADLGYLGWDQAVIRAGASRAGRT